MNSKLLVFGIDGGTWEVLLPLINMNKLPTFSNIIKKGVHGDFVSTFPPTTGPAWLSMATGKNPGKTGVFDFLTKKGKEFEFNVIGSFDYRKNNPYWDLLNKEGYKTYLINHPMLYPLYKLNGVMVAGMGNPESSKISYTPSLEKKIFELVNDYWTIVEWDTPKYHDKKILLRDLQLFIEKQFKVLKYLINDDWDLFLHVSSGSDFLQHAMWRDWKDDKSEYHQDFVEFWENLDKEIGNLLKEIENTNVFFVSDHGFGHLNQNFNLSKWLAEKEFIKITPDDKLKNSFSKLFDFFYKKIENTPLKRLIVSEKLKLNFLIKNFNIGSIFPPEVDVSNSKVIPGYSSAAYGALHITDIVNNYEEFRDEVIKELKKLEITYGFNLDIFKREEIYWGDKTSQAPDILFKINDHGCNVLSSTLKGEIFSDNLPFKNKSGSHRNKGIFCAFGPDIKEGKKINAKIYDLAPTILHIFNVPIPSDIDGRVLIEIFKEDSEYAKRKPKLRKKEGLEIKSEDDKLKDVIKDLKLKKKL